MPEFYKRLSREELENLPSYTHVYITCKERDLDRTKALTLCVTYGDTFNLQICTDKTFTVSMTDKNDGEYGVGWYVEIPDGIEIMTPLGLLHASVIDDETHPGIEIDLYPNGDTELPPIRLAMTEYTEFESLCSYMPDNPAFMQREIDEVPRNHIVHINSDKLAADETPDVCNATGYRVKPTLVTRAWPEPKHETDESYHRTFHET